jgi:hypothetical protein
MEALMSDSGSPSADAAPTPRSSHHTLKVVGGVALVLAIGGGAYGIAMAFDNGATPAPASPNTTSPGTGALGGGGGQGAGFGGAPATRPQATGTVQSVGSSSFVVKTVAGTSVTVRVSAKTTYSDAPSGTASFADVKAGARVAAYGTVSGSTVTASRIVIEPAGAAGGSGGFRGGFGAGNVGTVKSVGSSSFVISTFSGSTVTVDVSGSTTYSERGSTSAKFSDLKAGVRVAVEGSGTSTVKATEVLILPAGNFRGGAGGGFGGGAGGGGGGFGGGAGSGGGGFNSGTVSG